MSKKRELFAVDAVCYITLVIEELNLRQDEMLQYYNQMFSTNIFALNYKTLNKKQWNRMYSVPDKNHIRFQAILFVLLSNFQLDMANF